MTQVFRSPVSLQTFSSKRDQIGHMGGLMVSLNAEWDQPVKWTSWLEYYRLFRLSGDQVHAMRSRLTRSNSWEALERWINENLDILYANPMMWTYFRDKKCKRAKRVEFAGGTEQVVDRFYNFYEFENDYLVQGPANVINMRVFPELQHPSRKDRFNMWKFKDALVCFGMLPVSDEEYWPAGSDRLGVTTEAFFEIEVAFLKCDWPNLPNPEFPKDLAEDYSEWDEAKAEREYRDWALDHGLDIDDPKDDILNSYKKLITE